MQREKIIQVIKEGTEGDIYLVGGAVRDKLLAIESKDIDIVVVGDARKSALSLSEAFGVGIKKCSQFETFLLFVSGYRIDIATARKEVYQKIGALPEIKPGSLLDDLARRDFTINSMALPLDSAKDLIIDPFQGTKDLNNRIIRVLHGKSFFEDPTRIFRAIRFAKRFNFQIEGTTASLIEEAIGKRVLLELSPQRIRNELLLCFMEETRWIIMESLSSLGIFEQIGISYPGIKTLRELEEFSAGCGLTPEPLFFMALADGGRFQMLTGKEKGYMRGVEKMQKTIPLLRISEKPKEVYSILDGFPDYTLVYAGIKYKMKEKVYNYLKKMKTVKLHITGDDIKRFGVREGKRIGEILKLLKEKKLEGKIKTREEELNYVKHIIEGDAI